MTVFRPHQISTFTFHKTFSNSIPNGTTFVKDFLHSEGDRWDPDHHHKEVRSRDEQRSSRGIRGI